MTVIDIFIIVPTTLAIWQFFQNRLVLQQLNAIRPVILILTGLVIIALFHLADLWTMIVLPLWMPKKEAMMIMVDLHQNLKWLISMVGVGFIIVGIFHLLNILFPRIITIQNRLMEKESYLKNILQAETDMAIIAINKDLHIEYHNPLAAMLFNEEQNEEDSAYKRVKSAYSLPERLETLIIKGEKAEKHWVDTIKLDGKQRLIDMRIALIKNEKQELDGYLLLTRDITNYTHIINTIDELVAEVEDELRY